MPSTQVSLQDLRQQHHSLVPPHILLLPPSSLLIKQESQEYLISKILNDPLTQSTRPPRGYSRLFWRKVIVSLEDGLSQVDKGDDVWYDLLRRQ
jgi:hypothetical protein